MCVCVGLKQFDTSLSQDSSSICGAKVLTSLNSPLSTGDSF